MNRKQTLRPLVEINLNKEWIVERMMKKSTRRDDSTKIRGAGGFVDLRPECECGEKAVLIAHGRECMCAVCYSNEF